MTTNVPTYRQLPDSLQEAVQVKVADSASVLGIDLDLGTLSARIAQLVTDASAAAIVADGAWYQTAHGLATAWASAYNLPVSVVAGVIAITSPQTSWTRNRQDAHVTLEARRQYPGVPASVLAERILDARHNDAALTTQPLRTITNALGMIDTLDVRAYIGRGPKVRSFWSNIVDPVGSTDVTVDTHTIRALLGDPNLQNTDDAYRRTLGSRAPTRKAAGYTDALYPYFAQAIADVGRRIGLPGHAVQAIAWCQWRRSQGAWGGTVDRDPVYLAPATVRAVLDYDPRAVAL